MAEINLTQLKAANDSDIIKNETENQELKNEKLALQQKNGQLQNVNDEKENELCQQLKDQEEKLEQALKDKESEVSRLALENEEHLKRVSELTAYIQQASQDREQKILDIRGLDWGVLHPLCGVQARGRMWVL